MRWLAEMGVFAKVVDAGSFGKAAEQLGLTRSAVSKQIGRLESGLGVKLLRRTTRAMSLTDAGLAVYEQCARLVSAAAEAEAAASRLAIVPRGLLRVSTTVAYGHAVLMPRLATFLTRFPELTVEVSLLDRNVDLAEEGYDLVLRLTDRPAEGLVARKLARVSHVLCASREYLDRHGKPAIPTDLRTHNCIRHSPLSEWRFQGANGIEAVAIKGNAIVSTNLASLTLVGAGVGCGLLPDFVVRAELATGRLVPLLPDYTPIGPFGNLFALYLPGRQVNPKVRAFVDWLIEETKGSRRDEISVIGYDSV